MQTQATAATRQKQENHDNLISWYLLNAKLNCFYVVTDFQYHLVTSLAGGVYMTRWHGSVNNRCVNFSRPLLGDQEVGKLSSNV